MGSKVRDFEPGEALPGTKYRVVRQIGAGGMGVVYQVVKPPEIQAVVKLMSRELTERAEYRERFLDEVRVLAQLDHPNIVKVSDYDSLTDGTPFYVMELLHGRTVGDVLSTMGTIPPRVAFEITRQLCEALSCAHHHDVPVVHRDIKPENIFLHAPRHGEPVVKLIDFGVVAIADRQPDGAFVGTWKYAAPEQIRGERALPATDIYAVGLVLYEMLCGIGPFHHLDSGTLVSQAHLHEIPPPVSRFAPWVPPSVVALIESALSKDPMKRPASAYAFAERLNDLEWATDGRRGSAPPAAGSIGRILTSVGEARVTPEPAAYEVPPPPPSVPLIGIQSEARHDGPTLQGVGQQASTGPGEDVLLEGLEERADLTKLPKPRSLKKQRASGVPSSPLPPAMPDVVAASSRNPANANVEALTLDAPPSEPMLQAAETTELDEATTRRRASRDAETAPDTFASHQSDPRAAIRSRRGNRALLLMVAALLMFLGLGTWRMTRQRAASATAAEVPATMPLTAGEVPSSPVAPPPSAASLAPDRSVPQRPTASAAPPVRPRVPQAQTPPNRPQHPAPTPNVASASTTPPVPEAQPAPTADPPPPSKTAPPRDESFTHKF